MNINSLISERSEGVVASIFGDSPVSDVKPEIPPPLEPIPLLPSEDSSGSIPPKEEFQPLTAQEIKAKARLNAKRLGQYIVIASSILQRLKAYTKLRKGDMKLIERHDKLRLQTGREPVYPPNHPYYEAKVRYDEFMLKCRDGDKIALLTQEEEEMLFKAYEAELTAKNKRKESKPMSVWAVGIEIFWMRAYDEFHSLILVGVEKIMNRLMQ